MGNWQIIALFCQLLIKRFSGRSSGVRSLVKVKQGVKGGNLELFISLSAEGEKAENKVLIRRIASTIIKSNRTLAPGKS